MRRLLATVICTQALGMGFFTAGCATDRDERAVASSAQELRAGTGTEGQVYLGVDLLVTDEQQRGVPCGAGNVTVTFETSRNGLAGPWVLADTKELHLTCNDGRGNLAMVVDNSGSLESELELLKLGVTSVRDQLLSSGGLMSLVRVSTESSVVVPLTKDSDALGAGIEQLKITNGWTALWDGIRMGNETLGAAAPSAKKQTQPNVAAFCQAADKRAIVVFTDGQENNSSGEKLASAKYPGDSFNTSLTDLQQLRVAGITTPIYAVGLGQNVDVAALTELAQSSGGRYIGIDSADDIPAVLTTIEEYFKTTHRACVELPTYQCGALDVRVTYNYRYKGSDVTSQRLEHLLVPCETRVAGRVATVLLTLSEISAPRETLSTLVANTVNFVSPGDSPRVLFVRDDFAHDEFANDPVLLQGILAEQGYVADFVDEPAEGMSLAAFSGYDVVWFSNPGYPVDDAASYEALRAFSEQGGGVVLQGDDLSASFGNAFPMSELTRLLPIDNGVSYCGVTINDNKGGRYQVTLASGDHPALRGIEGSSFYYGDDLDTTQVLDENTVVLAWATVEGAKKSCAPKPVITVYTP